MILQGVQEKWFWQMDVRRNIRVWIEVDTPYVKGKVVALVMNTVFVDLIVGNNTRVDIPVKKENSSVDKDYQKCQAD